MSCSLVKRGGLVLFSVIKGVKSNTFLGGGHRQKTILLKFLLYAGRYDSISLFAQDSTYHRDSHGLRPLVRGNDQHYEISKTVPDPINRLVEIDNLDHQYYAQPLG